MNPATGTFISMDSYQGSIYDTVTLHKYLYAGANPVQYTDPTGYSRLDETTVTQTGLLMIGESMIFAGMVALNIYSSLRKNLVSAAMSSKCTVSVTDWKNVILGFPAHEFDTKWLITIPMALASWQLFEAIYATDEDTSNLPGVPANEQDEEDKIHGIPAKEQNGAKIYQDTNEKLDTGNWNKGSSKTEEEALLKHYRKHGREVGATSPQQYLRKAEEFAKNLRGARKAYNIPGYTEGVTRYYKNGKYIDLAPDGSIISFGKQ